ncbi:MAG: hypothetical protein R2710_19755 [Acidimicrobiales bacterium]
MLRTSKSSALPKLTTRWAMSYLADHSPESRSPPSWTTAGGRRREPIASGRAGRNADTRNRCSNGDARGRGGSARRRRIDRAPHTAQRDDTTHRAGLALRLDTLGIDLSANRLEPAPQLESACSSTTRRPTFDTIEEWEAIIPLTCRSIDASPRPSVDFDDRPPTPCPGVRCTSSSFELNTTLVNQTQRDLKDHLYAKQSLALLNNPELKLWSRPGESADDFGRRCQEAAETGADADAEKIRAKLEAKRSSIETAIAKAEDRVAELETQAAGARNKSIIDIGSSILGGLLGGRKRSSSLATAARRAASGNKSTSAVNARLESARNRAAEKIDDLEQLELDLQEAMIEIDDEWNQKAAVIETVEIPLEKTDITVADMDVVWLPRSR